MTINTMEIQNRVENHFLSNKSKESELELFYSSIISSKSALNENEFSSLVSFLKSSESNAKKNRYGWKMAIKHQGINQDLVALSNKDLIEYREGTDSTGYENSIDLKLQYICARNLAHDSLLIKYSKIKVGALQLILAEYFFENKKTDSGLISLVNAAAYSDYDRATKDAVDMWLGSISSKEINMKLKIALQNAVSNNLNSKLISALEYSIEQTSA